MSAAVVALLRAARKKIAVKKRWTQGTDARSSRGRPVAPSSRAAVCWCTTGAIDAVMMSDCTFPSRTVDNALYLLEEAIEASTRVGMPDRGLNVPAYNDVKGRKHKEILAPVRLRHPRGAVPELAVTPAREAEVRAANLAIDARDMDEADHVIRDLLTALDCARRDGAKAMQHAAALMLRQESQCFGNSMSEAGRNYAAASEKVLSLDPSAVVTP